MFHTDTLNPGSVTKACFLYNSYPTMNELHVASQYQPHVGLNSRISYLYLCVNATSALALTSQS